MPRFTPRRFRLLLVVVPVALVGLACAGGADTEQVGLEGASVAGGTRVPLPTLPPIEVRHPGLYDAQGCAIVGPGESDCAATADDVDRAASDSVDGWRTLAGFVGPHYVTEVHAGAVALLDGTTLVSVTGLWTATGLVRNETASPVTDVVVAATLVAADGRELETVQAEVPVDPLRPGEPAPFDLESAVDTSDVADVRWSITSGPPSTAPDTRVLELVTWWDRPAGDIEPVDLYLYEEAVDGLRPYLLFGGVTNHGSGAVGSPTVVAAWLDDAGRVLAVAETDAITDPAGVTGGPPLAPGSSADFLFVVDAPSSAEVEGAQLMLWAVGR